MSKSKFKRFLRIKSKKQQDRDSPMLFSKDLWLTTLATLLIILGIATMITFPRYRAFADNVATGNGTQGTSASTGPATGNGTQGTGSPSASYNGGNSNYSDTPIKIAQNAREDRATEKKNAKIRKKQDKAESKKQSGSDRSAVMKAYGLASKKQQQKIEKDAGVKVSKFGDDGKKASKSDWKKFISAMKDDIKPTAKGNKAQKALYKALNTKDAQFDDKNDSENKDDDKDDDDSNSKSDSVKGVMKALKKGDYSLQKPHTLAGKIGQAIFNFFWSTVVGKWLMKNSIGGTIFGGATTTSQLEKIVQSDPVHLMYPSAGANNMFVVSNWLEPAMMGLAVVFMAVALILNATKMGWRNFSDPSRSRVAFYHSIGDTGISLVGLWAYPSIVTTLLQFDGVLVLGINSWMNQVQVNSGETLLNVALKLGVDDTTINMLSSGFLFGGEFSGSLFCLIYLFTYLGLSVWIMYYYFIRSMVFTVLVAVGPLFIAFWSTDWGKGRALNWIKEMVSTIFVQVINALVLLMVSLFMAWNNSRITLAGAKLIVAQNNWAQAHKGMDLLTKLPVVGHMIAKGVGKPMDAGPQGFEVMVIGFIIMITFIPLSRSLAELFGLQTRMLDNIHQSTSQTLQTAAMIGGAALGISALGLGNVIAAHEAPNFLAGIKKATGASAKGHRLKSFAQGYKDKAHARLKKRLANHKKGTWGNEIAGIMGAGTGQMLMASAGLGADVNPLALASMTKAGGEIGTQATTLAKGGLNKMGLKAQELKKKFPNKKGHAIEEEDAKKATKPLKDQMVNDAVSARDKANGDPEAILQQMGLSGKDIDPKTGELKDDATPEQKKNFDKIKDQYNKAKAWNRMSDKEKHDLVAKELGQSVHGGGSGEAGYAKLGEVKNKMKGVDESFSTDKYDSENGIQEGHMSEWAIQKKAEHYGITNADQAWQSDDNNKQKTGESFQDYLKRRNDNLNNVLVQGQRAIANSAMETFGIDPSQDAVDKIYGEGDKNKSMGGIPINTDQFRKNLTNKLADLGFSDSKIGEIGKQIDSIDSKPMLSALDNPYGEDTAVIDSDMYRRFTNAQQQLTNLTTGLGNVTAEDFQHINTNEFTEERAQEIRKQSEQQWKDLQKTRYASKQAYDKDQIIAGADLENPYSVSSWLGGYGNSGYGYGGSSSSGGVSPSYDTYNQRIMAYNRQKPESLGMTMKEARQMVSIPNPNPNAEGDQTIVPSGSFRILTTNGSSMIQAKDNNGVYHMVGNLGLGDTSLQEGQEVYTDLDLTDNNIPVFARDPMTHQTAGAYTIGGDGVSHIPFSFTNGFQPDISSMLPTGKPVVSEPEMPMSLFHNGKLYARAPEYQKSLEDSTMTAPTVQQMKSMGYNNFRFVMDNQGAVITAEKDGVEQAICAPNSDAPSIFSKAFTPTNHNEVISIPLNFSDSSFSVPNNIRDGSIRVMGDDLDLGKRIATENQLLSYFGDNHANQRKLSSFIESNLIFSTPKVLTNEISNTPANTSINPIATFTGDTTRSVGGNR